MEKRSNNVRLPHSLLSFGTEQNCTNKNKRIETNSYNSDNGTALSRTSFFICDCLYFIKTTSLYFNLSLLIDLIKRARQNLKVKNQTPIFD